MWCPAEPWDKPTATEGFSRAGTQLHCTQRASLFHSSGARQRWCQVSQPKKHIFFCKHYRNFKADQVFISPT